MLKENQWDFDKFVGRQKGETDKLHYKGLKRKSVAHRLQQ